MSKIGIALAAGTVLSVSAAAMASGDEVINIGTFIAPGGGSVTIPYIPDPSNTKPVIGFKVEMDFAGSADGFTWASDLEISFNGWGRYVGGFDGNEDLLYSFQGSGSNPPGHYVDTANLGAFAAAPLSKGQLTGFTLKNDFSINALSTWNNITITLIKVPTPGATALLGLAGLATLRRRR